jgi:hypothetical protein
VNIQVFARALCLLLISLISCDVFARLVAKKNPLDGVLDAELVAIVERSASGAPDLFTVDEVFLGTAKPGDSIELEGFKLARLQQYGPDIVEPITRNTRILVFLNRKEDAPTVWEPTYFKTSYFWVHRPEEVGFLRAAAEHAVQLRKKWRTAADLSDPEARVAALWPFLSLRTYGVRFVERTTAELKAANPVSGQYLAAHLESMSHNDRMQILGDAGEYGSEELHMQLVGLVKNEMSRYEAYVKEIRVLPKDVNWNTMPEAITDTQGELYYSTAALGNFRERSDLPMLRTIAFWSAKYHREQVADAVVDDFRDMPDPANLPGIEAILREFLPGRQPGIWNVAIDAERSLCQHHYPGAVPLLAPFLTDDFAGHETEICLTEIVGQDLGSTPKAWMDWYKNHR